MSRRGSRSGSVVDDEEEEFELGPSKENVHNRERVRNIVKSIIRSEESEDTQLYKLMNIYDQLSYTFELSEKRKKVMAKYEEIKDDHETCCRIITSPCSAFIWTIKKSFIVLFYLIAFISFGYIIVSVSKKLLIG